MGDAMKRKPSIAIALAGTLAGLWLLCARSSGYTRPSITGHWSSRSDMKLDGEIDPNGFYHKLNLKSRGGGKFSGTYYNETDPSEFDGQIYECPRGVVLWMVQFNKVTGYYNVWNGRLESDNRIKGTFIDVDGNAGDFLLERDPAR